MKNRFNRIFITLMFSSLLLLGSLFNTEPVKAVNIGLTVGTITDAYLTTILTDVKTRQANWYTDYDYLVYTTSNYYWTVLLIPKVNVASFLFADADNDATLLNDIDNVYLMRYCSSANPCVSYRYTQATRVYYATYSYTTNFINEEISSISAYTLYYTNIIAKTQTGYYDPYCDMYCADLTVLNMESTYNLKKVPTSILQNLGIVSLTEDPGFEKLILKFDTIFGDVSLDLTWMKEGITDMIMWLTDISSGLTSGFTQLVYDVVTSLTNSISTWFVPSSQKLYSFSTAITQFNKPLSLITNITNFYSKLNLPGTRILPVTGTVFGTEVSWDMKAMIFDPFLPVAPFLKNIFSFILWALFMPRLFKEVQTLISGQVAT